MLEKKIFGVGYVEECMLKRWKIRRLSRTEQRTFQAEGKACLEP